MRIRKIISGGQTGVDRAALDAAMAFGVPHGGWCPLGRRAEDGRIPECYQLQEADSEEYAVRTRLNVQAADLTLIFSHGPLSGGSLLTEEFAVEEGKPFLHVDLDSVENPIPLIEANFPEAGSVTVNVAGPRSSSDPDIYDAVRECVERILDFFTAPVPPADQTLGEK